MKGECQLVKTSDDSLLILRLMGELDATEIGAGVKGADLQSMLKLDDEAFGKATSYLRNSKYVGGHGWGHTGVFNLTPRPTLRKRRGGDWRSGVRLIPLLSDNHTLH